MSIVLAAVLAVSSGAGAHGATSSATTSEPAPAVGVSERPAPLVAESDRSKDDEKVPQFGGPSSTAGQLNEDAEPKEPVFRFTNLQETLAPYFGWKERMKRDHGLALGMDYTGLYFRGSEEVGGQGSSASSGNFRLFGNWALTGRGTPNTGSLVFKVESRHTFSQPVSGLGFQTGYVGLLAPPFNDRGWMMTNLFWRQSAKDGRLVVVGGFVDPTDYLDIYGLINPWMHFSNLVFSTGIGAMPVPDQGLGAALGAMLSDNFYVVAGVADANGDPTSPWNGFDTFFTDREYFTHVEIGHTTSFEERYLNNTHLTLWHVDAKTATGSPNGWGGNFSWARFFNGAVMPFVRAGFSEDGGALLSRSVSTGVGYYMSRRTDLLGFGLNWGRPSTDFGANLKDQYTAEVFYRLQFSPNFAITPDLQYVVDPALNPNASSIWYAGVRARLSL